MSKRASVVLPPEPSSVPAARAWAGETVGAWGCDDLLESVRLATSELVGNGVRHAGTELEVVLVLDAEELRVAVTDAAPGPITRGEPDMHSGSGRGLVLIERISDRWGVEPIDPDDPSRSGKTVWAAWDCASARDGGDARRDGRVGGG